MENKTIFDDTQFKLFKSSGAEMTYHMVRLLICGLGLLNWVKYKSREPNHKPRKELMNSAAWHCGFDHVSESGCGQKQNILLCLCSQCCLDRMLQGFVLQVFVCGSWRALIHPSPFAELTEHHVVWCQSTTLEVTVGQHLWLVKGLFVYRSFILCDN